MSDDHAMWHRARDCLDLIGIGVGPSNLSLAALVEPVGELNTLFLEASSQFEWYPGLLFPGCRTQTSYLKDLVTLVDPTSKYSFVSFLAKTGRLYRFIITNQQRASRIEFTQYYRWVSRQLSNIRFGHTVVDVDFVDDAFQVRCSQGQIFRSLNIVLGTGLAPKIPAVARPFLGNQVLHAKDVLTRRPEFAKRCVAVVGGGQTGAELFLYLITRVEPKPSEVVWISSRAGFLPLDDSPFTNEWFLPNYVRYFRSLSSAERSRVLSEQVLAGYGISQDLLLEIYRRLYEIDFFENRSLRYRLLPSHCMFDLTRHRDAIRLVIVSRETGMKTIVDADLAVLCTGFEYKLPSFLGPLRGRIAWDDRERFIVNEDYSIRWRGPNDRRIFVQNASIHTHGIADPHLSLAAWRSAVIINSLCGRRVYDTEHVSSAISWDIPAQYSPEPEVMIDEKEQYG